MAVLETRPRCRANGRRLAQLLSAALMIVTAGGCMLFDKLMPGHPPLAFSHELHVGEQGLACINCHQDAKRADDPGMPALDQCLTCHEELDLSKAPDKRIETLFQGDTYVARHASRLSAEVVFSHKLHTNTDMDCESCHTGIETNTRIVASMQVSMDACTKCHAALRAPAECSTCHREISAAWAPESHHDNWDKTHGRVIRARSKATQDRCTLCHSESTCVACHLDVPPENHNNFWRLRGHGLAAMIDRQNCAACHESDSCDRCHREVIPKTHVGPWAGTQSTHCYSCHLPLQDNGCVACHKETPGHLKAHPKPPDHYPGQNCRQCHGSFAPLPHVDNGSDCNACHF